MKTKSYLNHHKNIIAVLTISICVLQSCKKFVDIDPPITQLSATAVFQSEATAKAALSNIYTSSFSYAAGSLNSATFLGLLSADESENYSTNLSSQQVSSNQLTAANSYSTILWQSCYNTIYQCNALIEGLTDNPHISDATKKQLVAEAQFFRALSHMTLTSFFGRVPIVTTTDYRLNTLISRSSETQVFHAVISDLNQAKEILPADYTSYDGERLRANRWAAIALLSRAYLYNKEYEKAVTISSELIDHTALFSLVPLIDAFLKNSKEAIFQLKNTSTTSNTNEGLSFILTRKPTQVALRSSFYNSFEAGDQRKINWVGKITVTGIDYYFPYKYKIKTATSYSEYSTVLRLAEQYLIRAEANARVNKLNQAIADLDAVRSRAGLSRIATINPTVQKDELLDKILQERRSELFSEWAHRWIDLRRFARIDNILSPIKPGWRPTAALFPIPQSDLIVNVNLDQNGGY